MTHSFSTKANTLADLQGVIKSARIAPMRSFTVEKWRTDREECLDKVFKYLGAGPWIVRSSCAREDKNDVSNAGAFLSVTNVDVQSLVSAIEQVINSYRDADFKDQVLIQPMLSNVVRSGVAFSHDPNTNAPYRIVNWSEGSDTSIVTSGMGGKVWQQAASSTLIPPQSIANIITLLEELLSLFGGVPVDCEFAVTNQGEEDILWMLQARPLILSSKLVSDTWQSYHLKIIQHAVERGMQNHPFLLGQRTVYGVMPDWNPAEIIGIRPKPLALSLYRELITDSIWAYQRHNYGYRNLRSFPLMPHFFGLPYIDIRVSFNSFIPADLDQGIASRLVDYYIDCLLADHTLHDKVEFEIVFSCYTLDLPKRLECLVKAGFTKDECNIIANSLRNLTNRILHPKDGLWKSDAAKLNTLKVRRDQLMASNADPLERIYWLLEDAKRYGTLPFAGLARTGFIAVQMLRSLVNVGIFSEDDYDAFIASVSTVSSQLTRDRMILDKKEFLYRYGHLRPGTYDILSPRYDEEPEHYFDWSQHLHTQESTQHFEVSSQQNQEIMNLMEVHGLQPDVEGLLEFMKSGIELRELAKFHFTQNLSDALVLITEVGKNYGFSKEDLAYCDIRTLQDLHITASDPKDILLQSIEKGKLRYTDTLKLSLPPLITRSEDVWGFEWPETSPNFITQKQVTAPVIGYEMRDKLENSIICIPSADPGYDWLFAYPIAGLITAWGGANSHMAIRAGEMELPAVIGAGEMLYRRWSEAQRLHIDCAGRRVNVLT